MDRYQDSYREAVNASIGFAGSNVDFLAKLKALDLVEILDRRLGGAAQARVLDPPRRAAAEVAARAREARVTRSGGLIAIYEHNPFNPLTRVAVSRCEFDVGVELLRPGHTRRLLDAAEAPSIESRFITFFPIRGTRVCSTRSSAGSGVCP